jgi:hypothetical protein
MPSHVLHRRPTSSTCPLGAFLVARPGGQWAACEASHPLSQPNAAGRVAEESWAARSDSVGCAGWNFNSFFNSKNSLNPAQTSKIHRNFFLGQKIMKPLLLFF